MRLRILLFILCLFLNLQVRGNMASPIDAGSTGTAPFISEYVDILWEKIIIIPDNNFSTSKFTIEYQINTKKHGFQIPFVFSASEFKEDFRIWMDDREVELIQIPDRYTLSEDSLFRGFAFIFDSTALQEGSETVAISWDKATSREYLLSDLKYFKVDLSEGIHNIRVEYIAERWIDSGDWVKEFSFHYDLSPANYWRSFGELEVILDATNFPKKLSSNLGNPSGGKFETLTSWKFSKIPVDMLEIIYIPELNSKAKILIDISPKGLTLIFGFLLFIIHLILMIIFRKNNLKSRFSWVMIAGCIILPFIGFAGYVFSYEIIDSLIGNDAGGMHGYTFLVIVFYPLVMPVYWVIMWLIDRLIKRRLVKKLNK